MATVVNIDDFGDEKQAKVLPTYTKDTASGRVTDAELYKTTVASAHLDVRLGFVRKVFSIVAAQLLCTVMFTAAVFMSPSLRTFVQERRQLNVFTFMVCLGTLFALLANRHKSPLNMKLLAAFTVSESIAVATAVSAFDGVVVLQAGIITAAMVCGLVTFTFQTKRDFTSMLSVLVSMLWGMMALMILHVFLPFGGPNDPLMAGIGAALFSLFIVVDTQMMLHKLSTDEYILCAINLYLDILNLFLEILRLMNSRK